MFCKICETNIGQIMAKNDPPQNSAKCQSNSQQKNCAFCLGLLCDDAWLDSIAEEAGRVFVAEKFDGTNFLLGMNMPNTQVLRELIVEKLSESKWAPALMSPKELVSRILMTKIAQKTGLHPSLNSNLILTISIETDEFADNDFDFFIKNFPNEMIADGRNGNFRKRKKGGNANSENDSMQKDLLLTKQKMMRTIRNQMDVEMAKKYKMLLPTRKCTFSATFEREPVFIAGRYCKYSRNLPQSPWGPDSDDSASTSVAEKVSPILVKHFGAISSKFSASGREDVDVRMLGSGRPFVVQLLNAHRTAELDGPQEMGKQILADLGRKINSADCDISIHSLTRVSGKQAQILNVGQEEKRKTYSALCYSKVPLNPQKLEGLGQLCPVEIHQKTVIRVLKRRPLLDRVRHIHWMTALQLDQFHFQLRLQTQAGTYVKEFVHGDFGRTRPSLAELMGLELGQVDILELDVLEVDLEWPPPR